MQVSIIQANDRLESFATMSNLRLPGNLNELPRELDNNDLVRASTSTAEQAALDIDPRIERFFRFVYGDLETDEA